MKQCIYLYEGECEKNLIKSLKSMEIILPGRVEKFNFWEKDASLILRRLKKNNLALIVFDVDVTTEKDRFISNISKLAKRVKEVILLPQHPNFEGELSHSCNIPSKALPKNLYGERSKAKLKRKLASDPNLFITLKSKGFEVKKMWSRVQCYKAISIASRSNIKWGVRYILK